MTIWSEYKKPKEAPLHKNKPTRSCPGCDSHSHGQPKTNYWASKCQAWGKTCQYCHKPNHFVCVCHQKPPENANALIAHLTYNNVKDVFAINNDNSIDEIPIILSVNLPKFKHLPPKEMMIFPDSRARICIAGLQHMHTLGLLPSNLISCYKQIKGVGGSIRICKGWVPITFNIATFQNTQPVYICDKVNRIFLSKTGYITTKIISSTFPFPMNFTCAKRA